MATIEDLQIKPISEMTHDEAIEYIRQIRLSRRIPVKKPKKTTSKKKIEKKMSKAQAQKLLDLLGG